VDSRGQHGCDLLLGSPGGRIERLYLESSDPHNSFFAIREAPRLFFMGAKPGPLAVPHRGTHSGTVFCQPRACAGSVPLRPQAALHAGAGFAPSVVDGSSASAISATYSSVSAYS
jgi:hypothetical protein